MSTENELRKLMDQRVERFEHLLECFQREYTNCARWTQVRVARIQNYAAVLSKMQRTCGSTTASGKDPTMGRLESELSMALENHRLYTQRLQRLGEMQRECRRIRAQRLSTPQEGVSPNKSISTRDLSSGTGGSLAKSRLHASTSAIAAVDHHHHDGAEPTSPRLPNKFRRLHKSVLDLRAAPRAEPQDSALYSTSSAMNPLESELAQMVGRFQFEVRAIVGFARLAHGDVFEIAIRHGQQKWKTRGKTQVDRTQKWSESTATLNCVAGAPIVLKVTEVRMFRSRCLNERQFDPIKFLSHQPQLVTMNLNNTGSIKLQLIVTWLPLLTSKKLPFMGEAEMSGPGDQQQMPPPFATFNHHLSSNQPASQQMMVDDGGLECRPHPHPQHRGASTAHGSRVGDIHPAVPSQVAVGSVLRSKSAGNDNANGGRRQPQAASGDEIDCRPTLVANGGGEKAMGDEAMPKFCLRDKKREREHSQQSGGASLAERERWRSSTTILDSVYKDISKSILTIDDLSTITSSRANLAGGEQPATANGVRHKAMVSEGGSPRNGVRRHQSQLHPSTTRSASHQASSWGAKSAEGAAAAIAAELSAQGGHEESGVASHTRQRLPPSTPPMGNAEGAARGKTKLSSLKKSRHSKEQVVGAADNARLMSASFHHSSPPLEQNENRDVGARQRRDFRQRTNAIRMADSLLEVIDALRTSLRQLQQSGAADYTELTAFEACMLNWEAVLKLNKAAHAEENRAFLLGTDEGGASLSSLSVRRMGANRGSVYTQHSPSTASDETEDGVAHVNVGTTRHLRGTDHIYENDSGIDSLRGRHVSPYPNGQSSSMLGGGTGAAQRRFNKLFRERRKSLGAMLESVPDWLMAEGHPIASDHERQTDVVPSATGHPEIDHCLGHHLRRADASLKAILAVQETPFEYSLSEMLSRVEQDTLAMETLLMLSDSTSPAIDVKRVMSDFGASLDLQQIWLATSHPGSSALMVVDEKLRQQFADRLMPIVEERYPLLVSMVLDNLMLLLCRVGGWESAQVSLFQFLHLFHDKNLPSFVEILSHEAWINANLASGELSAIREVMARLRQVPVVPPMESLHHLALVLSRQSPNNAPAQQLIEKYLRNAAPELAADLATSFVSLLEHDDNGSRFGACRALAILRDESAVEYLDYLAVRDICSQVRLEAKRASNAIRRYFHDYQEITKI